MLFVHLAIFHQMAAFVKDLLYDVLTDFLQKSKKNSLNASYPNLGAILTAGESALKRVWQLEHFCKMSNVTASPG